RDLPSFPTRRSSDLNVASARIALVRDAATTICRGSFLRVGVLDIRSTVRSISPLSEELQQHRPVASHGFHSHRILRFNARYGGRSEEHTSELQSREN